MRLKPKNRLLIWRLEPLETWDKTKPRGIELHYKRVRVAQVIPFRVNFTEFKGWYWLAELAGTNEVVPGKTTVQDPVDDLQVAKSNCEAYVRGCLGKPRHGPRRRLSWAKDVPDPNRSTVLSPPLGGKFLLNEKVLVGEVRPFRVGFGEYQGWYWTAKLPPLEEFSHLTVEPRNTKDSPVSTLKEAKDACDSYLRSQLLISPPRPPRRKKQ